MSSNPPRKRRRADGIATRQRVLEVATSLFASGGYSGTSLRQIAAAAGIDIATLKYHFDDKPNLFAQVYQQGHERFLVALAPILNQIEGARTREDVRQIARSIVVIMQNFVEQDLDFVRLTLFRLLEDNQEVIVEEESLQTLALSVMEQRFEVLVERGVMPPIDTRALVAFLVSSFATWQVTARVKTSWVGDPSIDTPRGKARSERFLITAIERLLGVEEVSSDETPPPPEPDR